MTDFWEESVLTLVGAGGKTSLSLYLAALLAERGKKVVLTTTTRIYPLPRGEAPLILEENPRRLEEEVKNLFHRRSLVQVGQRMEEEKVVGLQPETVEILFKAGAERVLVEADGARGLAFKFPGENEPVLPRPAGRVLVVLGAWGLGQPFSPRICHRPELISRYLDWEEGKLLEGEDLASLLLHPRSYLPRLQGEKVSVILNGARGPWQENECRRLAVKLLGEGQLENVFLVNLRQRPPLWKLLAGRQEPGNFCPNI